MFEENDIACGLDEVVPDVVAKMDEVSPALLALAAYGSEMTDLGYSAEEQLDFLSNQDNIAFLRIFSGQSTDRIHRILGELSFD